MKNKQLIILLVLVILLIGGLISFGRMRPVALAPVVSPTQVETVATTSPENATYLIDNEAYTLRGGKTEKEAAPNSAAKITTELFGAPVYGDLNNDGIDDAAVLLVQNSGGSGTFYYAAVAVGSTTGSYSGTNAIFLGDRIAPQTTEIRNGVLIVNYADRKVGEPMSARPSVGVSKYITLSGNTLVPVPPLSLGEQVMEGYITIGHEALSFRPCGEGKEEYWIMGNSPALQAVKDTYNANLLQSKPYTAFFGVVVGKFVDAPKDGFGRDYTHAIAIKELVRFDRGGSCKSDKIVLANPSVGAVVASPLSLSGRARGTWYFEGSFPVVLTDWDGKIIAQGPATAQSEWMTTAFVPFTATLTFTTPPSGNSHSDRGYLILKKDNPSGLPEHDDALEIPVYFK